MSDTVLISISNAKSLVETSNRDIMTLLMKELSYTNENAAYAFYKHEKAIARYALLMKREKNELLVRKYQGLMAQAQFNMDKAEKEKRVYLIDRKGYYPTGLTTRLLDTLDKWDIYWELKDLRKKDFSLSVLDVVNDIPELRHYQKKSVAKFLEDERGILVSPTGSGKTVVVCELIRNLGVPTLVITPNKSITDNMVDALLFHFGNRVKRLSSKDPAPDQMINVCNIQTLSKLPADIFQNINACVIDEFHHSSSAAYTLVNEHHLKNCYHRFGVTATNFRNSGDDLALEGVLSNVVFEYKVKEAITEGFIARPEFVYINNVVKKGSNYPSEYRQEIVENEDRNNRVVEIANNHSNDSVIILVQQIPHGERLVESLPQGVLITGKEDDETRTRVLQDFREGKIKLLIGTSVIGEGVDLPIANVLVLAGGGKSKIQVIQNVGRVLRKFEGKETALIYDFQDKGGKYLDKHFIERRNIYDEVFLS